MSDIEKNKLLDINNQGQGFTNANAVQDAMAPLVSDQTFSKEDVFSQVETKQKAAVTHASINAAITPVKIQGCGRAEQTPVVRASGFQTKTYSNPLEFEKKMFS